MIVRNSPILHPAELPGTRYATTEDFSNDGKIILDVFYYEYMYGSWTWEMRWTEPDSCRETMKVKLIQKHLLVPIEREIYNQKPLEQLLNILQKHNETAA